MGTVAVPASKPTRRTSKLFLLVNTALAWCIAFYSVHQGQASAVVASALALIASLYGAYVGIGHLDYRRFLSFFQEAGGSYMGMGSADFTPTGPAMPPPPGETQ